MSINRRKQCCLFDVFRKNDILKMVLTVAFLFLFTHTGAQELQWEGPQNTQSVVGSNVTLKCVSPYRNCSQLDWTKYSTGSPMTILRNGGITATYRERYSIDNSSGCNLVIKDVELTDAGRFICSAIVSTSTMEKSAYLIILQAQPSCSINASLNETVEKDGVRLTCEVTYNGTDKASMVWKGVNDSPDAVKIGKTMSRSYSFIASSPEVPSFTCATLFAVETKDNNNEREIEGLAKNNISVSPCSTPAIKVLYYVKDVTLSPSLYNYPPGTPITCAANGHPSPTFKWQEVANDGVWMDIPNQKSSVFTMTDVSSKRYKCVAMNVVRGANYNVSSHEFQVNNTGSTTSDSTTTVNTTPIYLNLAVQIGVGVGVGVILLVVLLICFCVPCCPGYKCCHSSEKVKIREEQPLTENPDIYSNINDAQLNAPKAKPRSAEPPKLPQNAPPQAKPRTDNKKAVPANAYHHEEVTYAELAREDGPHQVIPKNNHVPQETLYAAVGTA